MHCKSNEKVKWESLNFYAISNETLFYPYEFNGIFLQFGWKSIFQNSEKLSPIYWTPKKRYKVFYFIIL